MEGGWGGWRFVDFERFFSVFSISSKFKINLWRKYIQWMNAFYPKSGTCSLSVQQRLLRSNILFYFPFESPLIFLITTKHN